MVVWTKRAECKKSGLAAECTLTSTTENNMRGLIDLAIAETNTALALSGVAMQLHLVHAYREPVYIENTSNAFGSALSSIRSKDDGILDDVHVMRSMHGADIVAMIIDGEEHCGMAYSGPMSDLMFFVTAWNCATGFFSFGHGVGCNMVCFLICVVKGVKLLSTYSSTALVFFFCVAITVHQGCYIDKGSANACEAEVKYNYGWRDPSANFRSILSHKCTTLQCDNMPQNECPRVQRFSNIYSLYNGVAIGSPQHDNARQLNEVREMVAAFYQQTHTSQQHTIYQASYSSSDFCSCNYNFNRILFLHKYRVKTGNIPK